MKHKKSVQLDNVENEANDVNFFWILTMFHDEYIGIL